ncbi:hypothetical protein BGX29_006358 [Mortierella sp. GBA35]|nr:hypothetical protein BGX29_006358 [Mortierella sp. GBA35]
MLIPDVLYLIAPNLDNRSLVACLQVSRLWNQVFTPYFWTTTRPETLFERQLSLLTKYGRHIRDLRIEHVWMTFIVLYAKPTQLRSVSFKTHSSYYKATKAASETKMNRTRACWQLLLDNPNLERVEFTGLVEDNLIALVSANTNDDECSMPRSDGKAFLIKTVSGLTKLGHLQIGGIAGDYLLPRLATFPRITSFVYSGEGDPWSGLDVVPSLTLLHLRCRSDTSIPNLRSIIQAFPDLRSLTLNIIRGVERNSPLPKEIVHTHLERVAGTTMFCLLQANVRYGVPTPQTSQGAWSCLHAPGVGERYAGDARLFEILDHRRRHPLRFVYDLASSSTDPPGLSEAGSSVFGDCRWDFQDLSESRALAPDDDGTSPCPTELNQLLVACTGLKTFRGGGHAVMAYDMLQEPFWTCMGLEELNNEIHKGIMRNHEESVLFQRRQEKNKGQRGFNRSQEYDLVGVFGLELTLETGMTYLSSLTWLKSFSFKNMDHRIGSNELVWMRAHWPLEELIGIEREDHKSGNKQYDAYMKALRSFIGRQLPGVRLAPKSRRLDRLHDDE